MSCPICGEHCTCPRGNETVSRAALLDPEPQGGDPSSPGAQEQEEVWRQEVALRVDAFCARRGRKRLPRIPSLSLDFERASRATVAAHYAIPEPQVEPPPEPPAEPSNLIEFPKPAEPAPSVEPLPVIEELAEPILEKPRILDAEEPSGLLFGGGARPAITLESAPVLELEDDGSPAGEYATISRRIFAGILDAVLIAVAAAAFATVSLHIAGSVPQSRTMLLVALALPVLLWATYEYLFLVHAAATPGMRALGLRLRTFDDQPARRRLRRWRAIAMMVSGMALGLGFLWASVDEYGLCWHDRITRTVLRRS